MGLACRVGSCFFSPGKAQVLADDSSCHHEHLPAVSESLCDEENHTGPYVCLPELV